MRNMSPKARQHKADYDAGFQKDNVTRKTVYFNKNNPEDMEIAHHIEGKGNTSGYIKDLVREDMGRE